MQPLIDALNDESDFVRSEVVSALGDIKSETAVQPLINLLKNVDEDVDVDEYIDEYVDGDELVRHLHLGIWSLKMLCSP